MNDSPLSERIAFADLGSGASAAALTASEGSDGPSAGQAERRSEPCVTTPAIGRGRVALDPEALRNLRHGRMLSQQDLADECERRRIRISIATIKRAETGHAVRFRIARELARCFEVQVTDLLPTCNEPDRFDRPTSRFRVR